MATEDRATNVKLHGWQLDQLADQYYLISGFSVNKYKATKTIDLIVKIAHGNQIAALEAEYQMYTKQEIFRLQGTLVPECYGLYKGKSLGTDVAAILLECVSDQTEGGRAQLE